MALGAKIADITLLQRETGAAQPPQQDVKRPQRRVLPAPRIGAAVERVLPALHTGLVAVVDHGRAGKGVQQRRGNAQERQSTFPPLRGQAEAGALLLGPRRVFRAQNGQDAGSVVGAEEVKGAVKGGRRIVLPDGLHGGLEVGGVAALKIGQRGGAEGVVHQPVGLAAQQVLPPPGVGDLVGAVLPDLAQQKAVRHRFVHGGADAGNKFVRQLVRHVQPPAGRPGPQPAADNGVFPVDDELSVGWAVLVDGGQRADAPPRVVVRGPRVEAVPRGVGGGLALGRAGAGVKPLGVEIDAVGPGVVEHAVQQDAHPSLPGLAAQLPEVLLRPQHGVDLLIIRCVVPMVGGGLKNGAEVQRGHGQLRQRVQPGENAPERAAEKVPVADLALRVRPPFRRIVPIAVDLTVTNHSGWVRNGQAEESVWENLVCYAAAEPVRRGTGAVVYGELPIPGAPVAAIARAVQITAAAIVPPEAEVIPDQLRLRRNGECEDEARAIALRAGAGKLPLLLPPGKLIPQH